jgi:cephalosporin-C deacetylase-like acetyl esterase
MTKPIKSGMRYLYKNLALTAICILFLLLGSTIVKAANIADEVTFTATPASRGAIFKSGEPVEYNINIINSLPTKEDGKITYRITDLHGKFLSEDSVKIKLNANGNKQMLLSMPARTVGFYKINLMINVSDYDDTIRRAFGVDPDKIRSAYAKPADFDQFWKETKAELATVKPNFKMTEMPDSGKDNRRLYLVEMQSLGNITVRAWLTIPISKNKNKKCTVLLGLPGYQVDLKPGFGDDEDVAVMYLNVRGQGNSRDVIHTDRTGYITYNIDDKNKYVMRGVIMDCIRAIDFICTVPQLDKDKIIITGGSMGGFLAAATAGLDDRVKLFSAQNPILSDIRNLPTDEWPMNDIIRYSKIKPGLTMDKIYSNLDYFDTKNFAPTINSDILVGIGLLDHLAPPENEYAFYNNIRKNKKIMVFENLGHEVPPEYVLYQGRWMRDSFSLF